MGTNYYFRTRFKELQESYLKRLKKIGGEPRNEEWIHLGKKSAGWRFCWNPNMGIDVKAGKIIVTRLYLLSRQSIQILLMDGFVDIMDEYGEILTNKPEFLDMAFSKDGLTGDLYSQLYYPNGGPYGGLFKSRQEPWKLLGYNFNRKDSYDFETDGLIFSVDINFS
jgi:hypothetical protein